MDRTQLALITSLIAGLSTPAWRLGGIVSGFLLMMALDRLLA